MKGWSAFLTCQGIMQAKVKTRLNDEREKARAAELTAKKQLAGLKLVFEDELTSTELAGLNKLIQAPNQVRREFWLPPCLAAAAVARHAA